MGLAQQREIYVPGDSARKQTLRRPASPAAKAAIGDNGVHGERNFV